ncbi:metal ABC transporter permease [Corynebacterium flavescens]|uniref:metal ABC transporter permease n=1 Tax=Corynebacterium flavescens TaxID=28028 RepID=UPI00157FFA33|nr:metal ABC transporter permease [Corynebacterium flavescens]MDN6200299.1 metal ABC transporter permease [Corynebacterium flavescens]MDN6226609.1 metal ABC transporter permease [Corynebacterium flavescens]
MGGSSLSSFIQDTQYLLGVDFVQSSLIACALLGVLSGVMTSLIVLRQMSFSVHATSELALMGAAAALLFGANIGFGAIAGAIVAAIILAVLGFKGQQDSAIGVVMSFGLGLSVLFLHLYPGNATTAMTLLTGQIVGVSAASVWLLGLTTLIIVAVVFLFWRPMLFASADPIMAQAAGVPTRAIAVGFAILVGLAAAQSVQIVGSLLVMALLITPGAAAVQITSSPLRAVLWATFFAEISAVGGFLLSLAPGLPVSVFVTTISFIIYLVCRLVGWLRGCRAVRDDIAAARGTKAQLELAAAGEEHHTSTHNERCAHPD